MYQIPVLFIIFNRPKITLQAFQKIKDVKPAYLYIASDGHRDSKPAEKDVVEYTRKLVLDAIDWDCEVNTLFQKSNLGCGPGVYTAINWFFSNVEYGIILEDDCVANPSFFKFMQELLTKYEKDQRVGMIAGHNALNTIYSSSSYCFSRYKSCWGWATWRRAWKDMDFTMQWRNTKDFDAIIANMGYLGKDMSYWKYRLKLIDDKYVSAWDWQWYFSLAAHNYLTIFPAINLISNVGFGKEATHTGIIMKGNLLQSGCLLFPLSHPDYLLSNIVFDKAFYKNNNGLYTVLMAFLPVSFRKFIKNMLLKVMNICCR